MLLHGHDQNEQFRQYILEENLCLQMKHLDFQSQCDFQPINCHRMDKHVVILVRFAKNDFDENNDPLLEQLQE